MKLNLFTIWTYGIVLLTGVSPVLAQPELAAVRINSPIQIDGLLNEEAWQQAARTDHFTQREPDAGAAASEYTEVFICYDAENLYVAFNCRDRHISDIVATEMRRDEILLNNDCVEIYLDTYHDHRSAFFFATNALAARRDGMITAELAEEAQNWDWNGVWISAAHIDNAGWTAEFAIPFKNLRFLPGENQTWGLNFARHIPRKREEIFWSAIDRSYGFLGKFRISAYGHLSGLDLLQQPVKWQIKPFSLSGVQRDFTEQSAYDGKLEAGLDARYLLTTNLTATATINTDFAQVEADQEQVNLTRFELFFPEKREFFLEGSNSFYFGEHIFGPLSLPNILFFSRRIGLSDDGELIPLMGGVKITGKEGGSEIGFMNLFTDGISYINDDDEAVDIPRTNYTVTRLKQDVFSNSYIGLIGLNKESLEHTDYLRNAGIDATIHLAPNTQLSAYIAKSFETDNPGKEYAGYFEFRHMDDLFILLASQNSIQENFNADMGFFPRTDVRGTKFDFAISPRPGFLNIRQVWVVNNFNYITDQTNTLLSRINLSGFYSLFENGSNLFFSYLNNYERLTEDFEINDDINIPMGIYRFDNWYIAYQFDRSKPLSGLILYNGGEFFDGTLSSFGAQALIKVNRHLSIEAGYDLNRVKLPYGNFNTTLIRTRLVYAFHPDLFLKPFLQWNSDDKILTSNFLFNWHYIPGSDLFFVYNEELDFSASKVRTGNRTILLKLTYLLNF